MYVSGTRYTALAITTSLPTPKSVVICDTQPLAIEGLRSIMSGVQGLRFAGAMTTLAGGMELVRGLNPAVAIIDRAFGGQPVLDALARLRNHGRTVPIVWGIGMSNADALRMVQAGARGVLRKTSDTTQILECIRAVSDGNTWMEDTILQGPEKPSGTERSKLTSREQQVAELVEKGFKNKDIAKALGIQTGTVKIHLKHIFEKTGCRGRYGLALTGLREKGYLSLSM